MSLAKDNTMVSVGKVGAAVGLKGETKVRLYAEESENLYEGAVLLVDGKKYSELGGDNSVSIPISNKICRTPCCCCPPTTWSRTPVPGKFTKIVPNPIGTNNVGSYSFLIPKYINRAPTSIMKIWPPVIDIIF